jgi:DNA-binding winged helix-turn-helix (wHTH) protein
LAERTASSERRRRRWRFGAALFDEGSWSLSVGGAPVALEAKPAELLLELLLHAGETVSKDELLDSVWPDVTVVDASLSVAVSKLRKALGDEAGALIQTVPRIGYRLAAPVQVESLETPLQPRFAFKPGDSVPGRAQWRLVEALGDSGAADVWRARHLKTGEARVFKFADASDRLRSLRREAALARFLSGALGADGPHVELLEWNFEAAPFFLESRDGGESLLGWARARGGLAAVPRAERMEVAMEVAEAVAAVHGVGVLHRDLKPGNILLGESGGTRRIRLADFGQGALEGSTGRPDPQITGLPFASEGGGPVDAPYGTFAYRAPEVAAGGVATVASDVYALGLVVFQLAVGDFAATLAPGWEAAVNDPLLAADIAAASAGDPAVRLGSAAAFAERLRTLETRRAEKARAAADAARLADLAESAERRRERRPWVMAAAAAGLLGLAGTSAGLILAQRQRDEAVRQQAIAEASYAFLADDLLGRVDPAVADAADETIADAARKAGAEIDRRFAASPLVAGRLHQSLARALAARADSAGARAEFAAADRAFARAGPAAAGEAAIAAFQLAQMEAAATEGGRAERARAAMAAAEARFGKALAVEGAPGIWAAAAAGQLAVAEDRGADSLVAFERSAALAAQHPGALTPRERVAVRQRVVAALLRLDRTAEAEAMARTLADDAAKVLGTDHPDTLQIRLNVAQALLVNQKNESVLALTAEIRPLIERRFGPDHLRSMQLMGTRIDALKNLERYPEAMAEGARLWQAAARRYGETSLYAAGLRVDTARVRCRAGDVAGGLEDARVAYGWSLKGFGPAAALTHATRHQVADCLIASGRPAEAKPWLQDLDRKAVGELVGNALWGLHADLLLGQVALAAGETAEARRLYEGARPAFPDLLTDGYEVRRLNGIERALGLPLSTLKPAG